MLAKNKEKHIDWKVLLKILQVSLPYRLLVFSTIILAIILAPISMIRPKLIQIMVDDYILANNLLGLKNMIFIYFGLVLLNVFLRYLFIYWSALIGQLVIKDLRAKVYNKVIQFKLQYFDKTPIGKITTRTINDIEAINNVFQQGILTIFADLLVIIAILIIMFYTSWRLTLICLLTLPLLVVATYIFKEKVKESFQRVRNHLSEMNAFLNERISGMQVVQIFNAEKNEKQKFEKINGSYTQANVDSVLYYAIFYPVVELISALALALMVWLGARSYISDYVTLGSLIAFPVYLRLLFRPIMTLADKFNHLQMGLVAGDRVFQVLELEEEIVNTGIITPKKLNGEIRFEDVWFAYTEENIVLKGISFTIKPGQTVAIVGSTGSGKSSIINVLNRFYEINKGRILIDNIEVQNYETESLRQQIAVVLQDVLLFDGSVIDNIRLKYAEIGIEEIQAAAKLIGAHEFIENMPNGYEYHIQERGNNLSVGQRQLISFVRALVTDPDILILDEATSSVDSETEKIIQYAIEKLIEKRTSIIIAHRLSTIKHADIILVLDHGQIIERGSHYELLQLKDGRYTELYNLQFKDQAQQMQL